MHRRRLYSSLAAQSSLAKLFETLGHSAYGSRRGLHPLVKPLAKTASNDVLGLMRWPLTGDDKAVHVVRTQVQEAGKAADAQSYSVRPCGTIAQFARRMAVEADHEGGSQEVIEVAAAVTQEAGGKPYTAGELADSRLRAPQFVLLRVGPFVDLWESIARGQLDKGDETAALVAAERASAQNPGWGCCMYLQAELMGSLGRHEEQRDLALAALESPFWTLGAPLRDGLAAAQLSHIDDLRALVRGMEDKVREQQGAPPRSGSELATLRALDALDNVVRTEGKWDDARPSVSVALRDAGHADAADVAAVFE